MGRIREVPWFLYRYVVEREGQNERQSLVLDTMYQRIPLAGSVPPMLGAQFMVRDAMYQRNPLGGGDGDETLLRGEDEILDMFGDVSSLFRRQAAPEDPEDVERMSSREYFLTYLRTMSSKGSGLRGSSLEKLRATLRHYGGDSLDPSPALRGRLLWIYKARQHVELQIPAIAAILARNSPRWNET